MTLAIDRLWEKVRTGGGGSNPLPTPVRFALEMRECAHLGDRIPGQPCGSTLHKCLKFDEVTTRFVKCVGATRLCAGCISFLPKTPLGGFPPAPSSPSPYPDYGSPPARHLLFHLLPVSGNGVWQNAINQLRLRWKLFTGRKIISIATGGSVSERIDGTERVPGGIRRLKLDSVETVRRSLPSECELIEVENDPVLWEGASWPRLWDALASDSDPADTVLYAHAKGVTRKLTSPCHKWTDILHQTSLDYPNLVDEILQTKPVCGSLPKWGPFFGGILINSRWHYSGNFWWARVGVVLEKIRDIPLPLNAWAAEAWIGAAFHKDEAGAVFESRLITHLYKPEELDRVCEDFSKWQLSHLKDSTRGMS